VTDPASASRDSSVEGAAVWRQTEQILASPGFGTERRRRLLNYLVEKALSGEPLKEYAIGLDVFEKPPQYDPRLDPSVRVEIGRLRAKLTDYYLRAGDHAPVRIEIPKGSYTPIFRANGIQNGGPHRTRLSRSWKRRSKPAVAAAFLALCAAVFALLWPRFLPRAGGINSVVVLPFANLTGDSHNDYLSDGVTEELTDALAQVPTLRVVARTSAFQFKGKSIDIREIGRKVEADAVIEGSLAMVDGRLRLTVQVNRSRDGYHIFSRMFEGGPHDVGRLESDMAAPVVASLRPQVAVAKRNAPDPEAYELFLKARAYRGDGTRDSSDRAIAYLHQAIERDPRYADAYAALAGVYAFDAMNIASDPIEFANQAKAAATKALELDPNSAAAYSVLGVVDGLVLLDWKRGERQLRKSIAMMPQSAAAHNRLGLVLESQGRFPEAVAEMQECMNLDPLVAAPRVSLGLAYFLSGNYEQALRRFTEARDLHPDALIVHAFIGLAWEGKGQFERAMQEYKMVEAQLPAEARSYVAHLLAATGKHAEAMAVVKEMEHPAGETPNAFDIAAVYAGLGDKDSAFRWLDRAYERRNIWFLKVHPFLDPLRSDPRYAALLQKTGLE